MSIFLVKPQGLIGRIGDMLMLPIMYLLQWTLREVPERTHFWNNIKIKDGWSLDRILSHCYFLAFRGDPAATRAKLWGFIPLFHMGGWKTFKVLEPVNHTGQWFIGWYVADVLCGVSRIPLSGPVRVLIGPGEVSFFALDTHGRTLPLQQIGTGRVRQAGAFAKVPLL
jgi:hypothetical protein